MLKEWTQQKLNKREHFHRPRISLQHCYYVCRHGYREGLLNILNSGELYVRISEYQTKIKVSKVSLQISNLEVVNWTFYEQLVNICSFKD